MRLENIPKQQKVVLLPSGKPTLKFVEGVIVIHSDLRPCVVVEVDVPQSAKQKKRGLQTCFSEKSAQYKSSSLYGRT